MRAAACGSKRISGRLWLPDCRCITIAPTMRSPSPMRWCFWWSRASPSKRRWRERLPDRCAGGVQGGVFSPNEARNLEGLNSVEYGNEPRVQMQVVPLSAAADIPAPGPAAPPGISDAAPDATKRYQAAVSRDIEAMTARVKRPTLKKPVIRKTKANGLLP